MKNTAINTLKYTGIVTLSQYSGSEKIKLLQVHNEGGDSLFDFLANCLIGDFTIAKATRPTKVMLIERINSDAAGNSQSYAQPNGGVGFIYLRTKPEKVTSPGISKVRYSFLIPKEVVDSLTFDNLYLGLYTDGATTNNPEDYAAICKLELSSSSVASASLVVDWELIISNISTN